jgi:DNA-binding transcriptional MerR regulator
MDRPEYLSAADAARRLGVTPATVRLMHRRGELPIAGKTEGGMHLFSPEAVDRLAARRAAQVDARSQGLAPRVPE